MQKAIAKELQLIRLRKNLTVNEVANHFNLNVETIRRYERECIGLSVERLEELLNYYSVSKDIFFKTLCEYMHDE